jgi:hypothetical protein
MAKRNIKQLDPDNLTTKQANQIIAQEKHRVNFIFKRHESKNQICREIDKKKEPDEYDKVYAEVASIFGVKSKLVFHNILVCVQGIFGKDYTTDNVNTLFDFIKENKPKDAIEAMLLTQMLASHQFSMQSFLRAGLDNQTPYGIQENMARATKFTRTYIAQMDALKRYRSSGEHKIIVEKVNVENGGKAVIGDVNTQINNKKPDIIDDIV